MKQEEIRQLALRTAAGLGKGLLKGAGFAGKTALKGAGAAGKMLLKSTAAGLKSLSRMDRKDLATIGCIAAAATAVPVFLLAPGFATKEKKAPFLRRNFAHRGLHSRDLTVPENSLKAFELAAAAGYGIELDVQLSRDGQVVVFHDAELERVCGVKGKVEDLTFEELQELRLLHTEEKIPLFTDALAVIRGRGPLIVELKNGKRNKELCEKTYEILKNYTIMLTSINEQIRELRETPEDAPDHSDVKKRLADLHKRAKDITKKMQDLVEKMEFELK